jgi:solute:Na+ symporter, SSS family
MPRGSGCVNCPSGPPTDRRPRFRHVIRYPTHANPGTSGTLDTEETMNAQILVILIYSAVLIVVGAVVSRRVRTASDFLVAGRSLGPGLLFASFLAANIGAGSTIGAAGLGYSLGWSAWWWVGSAGIGCVVLAVSVGPKIWSLAHSRGFRSLGDFLEWRYGIRVRLITAGIMWIGSLVLLAAQLTAISLLLQVVAGLPAWTGACIGGLLMTSYFAAGGILTSATVNSVQLLVLLSGFVLAVVVAPARAGGWSVNISSLASHSPPLPEGYLSFLGIGAGGVLHYLALLVPSFIVSPGLIQKVYSARSRSAVRIGVLANAVCLLAFAAIPPALGILAAARFPSLQDPQFALFKTVTGLLPTALSLLAIAAIFSAEVSTCDAVLSMMATSFAVDIYRGWLRPAATEPELLKVSRISAIAAGTLGVAVTTLAPNVIGLLSVFYGILSVSLFVPVIYGLYSARPTQRAVLWGMAVSLPAVALLTLFPRIWPEIGRNAVAIGIVLSYVVTALLSSPRRTPAG